MTKVKQYNNKRPVYNLLKCRKVASGAKFVMIALQSAKLDADLPHTIMLLSKVCTEAQEQPRKKSKYILKTSIARKSNKRNRLLLFGITTLVAQDYFFLDKSSPGNMFLVKFLQSLVI